MLGSTIEQVLDQKVRVVYTLLLYEKIKSKYEKNLNDILSKKR